jgi:predicted Fe-S protein YdhL (DUF1289 family)
MPLWPSTPKQPILTPCVGVCAVASDGFCIGCHRTLDEIARWASLTPNERAWIMDEVLPQREAARTE